MATGSTRMCVANVFYLASVPGLSRSVRVLIMRWRQTFVKIRNRDWKFVT